MAHLEMTPDDVTTTFQALCGNEVVSVERLPGGSSHPTWQVDTEQGRYAVKLYPEHFEATAQGQAQLLRYLTEQTYPAPQLYIHGSHQYRHLLAVHWIKGTLVKDELLNHPDQAKDLGEAFGRAQARLHQLPVNEELKATLTLLTTGQGTPNLSPVFIHLDYHPLNVLVGEGKVTGVLDWENVRLGNARADVARTLSILSVDPAVSKLPRAGRQLLRRFRQAYVAGYISLAGEDALIGLKPYLTWAGNFMRRDLADRLKPGEALRIERWTRKWAG